MVDIFIHRRDIRWQDNTSLLKMENVIPIFIFTPEQIYPKKNKYFSNNLVEFMCKSLVELNDEYKKLKKGSKLTLFEGDIINVLDEIIKKNKINRIGFNIDYSPYSKKRDDKIINWAQKNKIEIITNEDMLLNNVIEGNTKSPNSDEPYKVFTPYYNHCKTKKVNIISSKKPKLSDSSLKSVNKFKISVNEISKFYEENENRNVEPGRIEGLKKLKNIKNLKKYNKCRNFLDYKTSNLSAYINLGIISIREVYHYAINKLGKSNDFIKELYWRDFYYNILYYFPHVVGNPFNEKYSKLKWDNNRSNFNKWCNGTTGFPIVDACMRQLNTTGYMHNRGRMIVASFLTKNLRTDWKWGEKYFAKQLIDYNISANNGGWQWASGTGTDAQPYFRIFNPWTQSSNYDEDASFIKYWIPELKDVPEKDIHNWNKKYNLYPNVKYPKPIVEHDKTRVEALKMYKKIF